MPIIDSLSRISILCKRAGLPISLFCMVIVFSTLLSCNKTSRQDKEKVGDFWVVDYPTRNIGKGTNEVKGIVLHHTATSSIGNSLSILAPQKEKTSVSCHAIIDTDGTRYILAEPKAVTWHAGYSRLNGRNGCNNFTIGIELQGNTCKHPLTDEQVRSAVAYMIPIIKKYRIPLKNIVTHEQVRDNWIKTHKGSEVPKKVDITQKEYDRVMAALNDSLNSHAAKGKKDNP